MSPVPDNARAAARNGRLHLALPKGRMYQGVAELLKDAGIEVHASARGYRPSVSLDACEVKILKPQNIVEMLHAGSRDVGFTGADWVVELDGEAIEILDTGLDQVRIRTYDGAEHHVEFPEPSYTASISV